MLTGMATTRHDLLAWVHAHGLAALDELFGAEAVALAGPKGRHQPQRTHHHWGTAVDDKTFLRGTQLTDAAGAVRFRTIYPGWYSGRTPHVHLKLRVGAKAVTTQLYFPDEVTNAVYARAPYDRHPNRDTTNATDRFLRPIADKSLVTWTMARDGDGYVAAATVTLRTS